jgi:hypothetical protein
VLYSHRARHLASKRLAAISSKGMDEILGMSSIENGSVSCLSNTPSGRQTPLITDSKTKAPNTSISRTHSTSTEHKIGGANRSLAFGLKGSTFGGNLGFRPSSREQQTKLGENQKSDMSVVDYFTENMRQKQNVGQDKPTPAIEETVTGEGKYRRRAKKEQGIN